MKFLSIVNTTNPEKLGPPPDALMQAIAQLGVEAGPKLKDTGGMKPVGAATIRGGGLNVDGPYAEAKEAVGGYAIYELDSEAEAVEWIEKFMELHRLHWPEWDGEVTLQQLISYGP